MFPLSVLPYPTLTLYHFGEVETMYLDTQEDTQTIVDETVIKTIIAAHLDPAGMVLGILVNVQKEYRFVPRKALEIIAEETDIPLARLYSICSFFDDLSLLPTGKYLLEVCDGTACHTLGAQKFIHKVEEILGIRLGETTPDGLITLRRVNCVGACSQAPLLVLEGTIIGRIKLQDLKGLVASIPGQGEDI